jgi:hypothetical protein
MDNITKTFNHNLGLKKELYKDNEKVLKQLKFLEKAFDLVSESKFDKALDVLTSGKAGSKIAVDVLSHYIQKFELNNYNKIQYNVLGIHEVSINDLVDEKWWKVLELDNTKKIITIAKTSKELQYNLINYLSIYFR